jgi:hypothetical protein
MLIRRYSGMDIALFIFDCMTSDVKSHADLKAKMIQNYPDKANKIIDKFNLYGF